MTRLTTRIAAGLGAIALLGSLSACAGAPGTAATVGDQRITVAEVDQIVRDLPAPIKQQAPGLAHPSYVLNVKMRAVAAEQLARERDVPLQALTEQALAESDLMPIVAENPAARELAFGEAEVQVLSQRLGAPVVAAGFAEIPVKVNPRYGMSGLEPVELLDDGAAPLIRNSSLSQPAGGPQ